MYKNFKHIYFIGIGGISMSGLAELMLSEGSIVSGSDKNISPIVKKLQENGANIHLGHNENNIKNDIDLVVYTSAVSQDNAELVKAKELNINMMDRAEFLGYIMNGYKNSIGVSGTHGKTTTTGMLSSILIKTDMEPTIFLGGEMDIIDGNIKRGADNILLTEACEYKRNFLKFNPTIELILNIDEDHLDYYKDIKDIELAFMQFANKLPENGVLIVNKHNSYLFNDLKCDMITFGMDENSDIYPINIKNFPFPSYTLMYKNEKITDIKLKVYGQHNILNSLAAAAACIFLKINPSIISEGLEAFVGTKRRYQVIGTYNEAVLIDDYAHHPTEMEATLKTARTYCKGKIITVFQPHTYTRTYKLLDKFAKVFKLSDETIILDIYNAFRETDTGLVSTQTLLDKMAEYNIYGKYAKNFEEAAEMVKSIAKNGDIIISMGAGNVDEVIKYILN